jgi:hypothetical protein
MNVLLPACRVFHFVGIENLFLCNFRAFLHLFSKTHFHTKEFHGIAEVQKYRIKFNPVPSTGSSFF